MQDCNIGYYTKTHLQHWLLYKHSLANNFIQMHNFISVIPRSHTLTSGNSLVNKVDAHTLRDSVTQQHSKHFTPNPVKKGTDTRVEIKNFVVVREVLHNNYRSQNLIGPYHFWCISPRNSTSFARLLLPRGGCGLGTRLQIYANCAILYSAQYDMYIGFLMGFNYFLCISWLFAN